jgi:hypothetical protein
MSHDMERCKFLTLPRLELGLLGHPARSQSPYRLSYRDSSLIKCRHTSYKLCSLRRGTQWRSWLRYCATSRKVAGSIPHEVIDFFNVPNPSNRTMALGFAQPLTEMNTRNVLGGKARPDLSAMSQPNV